MSSKVGIGKNVFILGLVSFFNDVASEMIYPLVPIFLTNILGAPVSIVGLIEGIAEFTASLLKVFSGWFSDKIQKRKPFIVLGYSCSAISKIFLALASVWPFVLFARFIDRFGKGVRTAARDALIAESSQNFERGKAFGFHRTLDTLGAVLGPILALLAIKFLNNNFRLIFLIAFVPALISILLLIFFVKEKKKKTNQNFSFKFKWRDLNFSFKIFLIISVIFALGNSSDAFLILRAQNLGLSSYLVVLAYVLYNLTYAIFSTPAGIISDKLGPKKVIFVGFGIFSFVYFLFGIIKFSWFVWILFPIYGIYMALTDGVGKAYISNLVPQQKIGTAFGIYQTLIGLTVFLASYIAGLLWTYIEPAAPFIFGGFTALLACFLVVLL